MPRTDYRTGEPIATIKRPGKFPAFNKGEDGFEIAGFFSRDRKVAERFAKAIGTDTEVFPTYLSLKKPYVVDAAGKKAGDIQFGASGKPFRDAMKSGEFDGAIIRNTADEGDIYVALDPTQIKSATGNRGTFDPSDPSILNARDDAPLPIGSARDQVFDYRTSRSIVKGLRDQARNTSDKVVATALRAYAREMTKETEEARKEYIALRGQLVGFSQNDPQWRNKACGGDR